MIQNACPHCGGNLIIMDTGLRDVSCNECHCFWQLRSVLIAKGPKCLSDEIEYEKGVGEEYQPKL